MGPKLTLPPNEGESHIEFLPLLGKSFLDSSLSLPHASEVTEGQPPRTDPCAGPQHQQKGRGQGLTQAHLVLLHFTDIAIFFFF